MNNPFICQTCYRSKAILEALNKIRIDEVGAPQCADCHSDLEFESVVIRQIHFDAKKNTGTPLPEWLYNDSKEKGLMEKVNLDSIPQIKNFRETLEKLKI
jgi:hypothetical protein